MAPLVAVYNAIFVILVKTQHDSGLFNVNILLEQTRYAIVSYVLACSVLRQSV